MICNFFIGGERYFFSSTVRIEKDQIALRIDQDLFHLQRRQNYRIKIPDAYTATLLISQLNKAGSKLTGQISDLSSGGCRVVMTASTPVLEIGDIISGHIVIGKREPLEIEGTIRHHKLEATTKSSKQTFGVEFRQLDHFLEGKLFAITMDLHREFFSRLKTS
jgi:c-di-GMP-binding flagellar brake protein YcgR